MTIGTLNHRSYTIVPVTELRGTPKNHSEWDITGIYVRPDMCNGSVCVTKLHFRLRRLFDFYVWKVILPVIFVSGILSDMPRLE